VAEIDPYATLGVPRTASRDEIARAYRRLAKRYHPDAGATPSPTMGRINDAWHVLSDTGRRARWDRLHPPTIAGPAHWTGSGAGMPVGSGVGRARAVPRPPDPPTPASFRDSPWMAVAAVGATLLVIGVGVLGVSLVAGPSGDPATPTTAFAASELRMDVPADWRVVAGDDPDGDDPHRVVAHIVTFPVTDDELCTAFGAPCPLADGRIPVGEASVIITAWNSGTPPVPEPVTVRPAGLDADRIIGGKPAAFELRGGADGYLAWWQLSPPGFPDRWIEVTARIGGRRQEAADAMLASVDAMVETIEFGAR
jgi:hypothetical protein